MKNLTKKLRLMGFIGGFIGLLASLLLKLYLGWDNLLLPIGTTVLGISFGVAIPYIGKRKITIPKIKISWMGIFHVLTEIFISVLYFGIIAIMFIRSNSDSIALPESILGMNLLTIGFIMSAISMMGVMRYIFVFGSDSIITAKRKHFKKSPLKYLFYHTLYFPINAVWFSLAGMFYFATFLFFSPIIVVIVITLTIVVLPRLIVLGLFGLFVEFPKVMTGIITVVVTVIAWFIFKDLTESVWNATIYSLICGLLTMGLGGLIGRLSMRFKDSDEFKELPWIRKWYKVWINKSSKALWKPVQSLYEIRIKRAFEEDAKKYFEYEY
ncbi:hypothetical protein HOD29_02715 [archaeon]|mgnify:CR=1 FL=1|jgi:hypothetical protein|nr:hypothetical protein [archaeon]